ncbi:MAG TPA: toxin TcdB middle/N-terminal domain-containing protein [Kofleriaceae bacterium]|nr:toxin TcdB middle/N-terminal domain-containing protein [Kofleriaceae bacterium]
MRKSSNAWKVAATRGMAAFLAVHMVFNLSPATAEVGDIFSTPAPMIGADPPKSSDIKDGDTSVASQTGALTYSYPIAVPPGRRGMAPRLALTYSSQAPVYGGIATGWNWNMSIPEIREDTSGGRLRTRYPLATLPEPTIDDRFVSTLAGGRALVRVTEPGDYWAYQYRAQADGSFDRYERIKNPGTGYKWRVYSTDGTVRYFGDEAQAPGCIQRTPNGGATEDYAPLTKEVDAFGNEVLYTYESVLAHECRIKNIRWGQNPSAGLPSFAQVDFVYATDVSMCAQAASQRDFRNGFMHVTGASRLNAITVTAFPPGGSPGSAVHTRQIALGYDQSKESCTLSHAPIKVLTSITESAWGLDSPLVTLPAKTFTYNTMATTLVDPASDSHQAPAWTGDAHPRTLAWGYRRNDDRIPTVEAMLLDVDGDGLLDRILNTPLVDSGDPDQNPKECRATWYKNTGPGANGTIGFDSTARIINLPRLKWRGGATVSSPAGSARGDRITWKEGCALNGMHTAFRNSKQAFGICSDNSSCQRATDPKDSNSYCNVSKGKGTACPPGGAGPGGTTPDNIPYRTYLNYRWLDMDGDGLVDLVAAVNGAISVYDIEKGNDTGAWPGDPATDFSLGEPSISGIPGFGQWPPCQPTPAGSTSICLDPGVIDGEYSCSAGNCPRWDQIANALNAPRTGHVPCSRTIEKQGPLGPGQCGVDGGCGGQGGTFNRKPYERCEGRYPWLIYRNLGAGSFASTPDVKYQPVPLESDNGDSSLTGPAIASTNHAVMDFDGDGALDAVVHPDSAIPSGVPGGYQVFLGDRSGQFGPTPYFFPTRPSPDSRIHMLGSTVLDLNFSKTSQGLIDFNGDGLPDHWKADANGVSANVILHMGTQQNIDTLNLAYGEIDTPVKPGGDTDFTITQPNNPPQRPILSGTTQTNQRVVDVDGDGRPDVVKYNNGSPLVYWNLGSNLAATPQSYAPSDAAGIRRFIDAKNLNPPTGYPINGIPEPLLWELKSDLVDLDGDGIAESVSWFNSDTQLRRARPTAPPRLMTAINNGRGLATTITYASMHDPSTVVQNALDVSSGRPKASPTNQWVVRSLTTTDQFNFGNSTTSYRYDYPVHKKDDEGRYAFRGFEKVTTTKPFGNSRVVQTYSYSPDWSGRLEKTVVMPRAGSGEGDNDARTIDKTTWTALSMFGGAVKTYHPTVTEHFTCANGQTETTCTASSAPGYTRTTSTYQLLASDTNSDTTPLLWQETSTLLQSGASTAAANGDRTTDRTFKLAANAGTYRLRPTGTTLRERVSGTPTVYARTAATWDPSYRMQLTDEQWFDSSDSNRAITRFEHDPATGNLINRWKPNQNNASTTYSHLVYDARQLFVANETNELGHLREYTWEYGTGTKLMTRGPNVRGCVTGCPTGTASPDKEQYKIRVDGLGRMIERWESFSGDGYVFNFFKVETNDYVDTIASGARSILHKQLIDIEGTAWMQDRTDLDGHGRVIKHTVYVQGSAPTDEITSYLYNPDSSLALVTVPDPTANTTSTVTYTYSYDSLGRTKAIRRPDQSGVDLVYDGVTTTTSEVVGAGGGQAASTRTVNDRFGRLVQVSEKTGTSTWATTTYGYDPHDIVKTITDPQAFVTTMAHDFAGRRTAITRAGRTWSLQYDRNGNVTAETVPGAPAGSEANWINTAVYDDLDRPTSRLIGSRALSAADQATFGNKTEIFTYDRDTNMTGKLRTWNAYDPSSMWSVGMDLRADIQGRPAGTTVYTRLPGMPQLTRWIYEGWFAYGPRQQVRHGDVMGAGNFETWSQTIVDPRGLPAWINVYNRSNTSATVQTVAEQTRNVAGLVMKRRTNVNTAMGYVESNWTYDQLGRVVDQTIQKGPSAMTVAKQTLTYYGSDDPKTLTDVNFGGSSKTFTYTYDYRHQLKGVTTNTSSYFAGTYAYGAAGRFQSANVSQTGTLPPGTEVKTRNVNYVRGDADPDRVTALTNVSNGSRYATYSYDAAGNMTWKCMGATYTPTCTGESFDYVYDGKDQLRRATRKLNNVVQGIEEYWYDKDGKRIAVLKKNASGVKTELVWFLKDTEAHYDGNGVLTHIYSHSELGTPVARTDRTSETATTTELQFHGLADHTIAAVDTGGTVKASFRYAPLGEVLESADVGGASAHRRRFNDKQQDELTSLSYYGARYYDKTLMGWTQGDPRYRYAPDDAWKAPRKALLYTANLNNALRYKDPDGRDVALIKHEVGPATMQAFSSNVITSNMGIQGELTVIELDIGTKGVVGGGGSVTAGQASAGVGLGGAKAEFTAFEFEAYGTVGPAKASFTWGMGIGFEASWDAGVIKLGAKAGVGAAIEIDVGAIAGAINGAIVQPLATKEKEFNDKVESMQLEAGLEEWAASDRAQKLDARAARAAQAQAERAAAERDQRTSKAAESCGANAECLQ